MRARGAGGAATGWSVHGRQGRNRDGDPIAFGFTPSRRHLAVVYWFMDEHRTMVYIETAYVSAVTGDDPMAKHMYRNLTPAERERSRRSQATTTAQKQEIIEMGRRVFERHERLLNALAALKAERQTQGVSLAELAARTDISKSSLSRLENDATTRDAIWWRCHEALAVQSWLACS